MSPWILNVDGKTRASAQIVACAFSEEECRALSLRLGDVIVETVEARAAIDYKPSSLLVALQIQASVVQQCVVTLDDVRADLKFDARRKWVSGKKAEQIDPADMDAPDVLEDGEIDLRDIIGEEISVHLPDYPRADDAVLSEDTREFPRNPEASEAFASLASLRDPE